MAHDLGEQALLVVEVVGDEAGRHPGLGGDPAHRRAVHALGGDHAPGGLDDPRAGLGISDLRANWTVP